MKRFLMLTNEQLMKMNDRGLTYPAVDILIVRDHILFYL